MKRRKNEGRYKKKAMVATWSDSDSSDSEDDEVANLCLMALEEPKVSSNSNSSELNEYSFDELQDAFDELAIEYDAMKNRYKKTISKLKEEYELSILKFREENASLILAEKTYETKINDMQVQIDDLNKKNENLHNSFTKFHMSHQKLNDMLETQRAFFDKDGIGYNRFEKETKFTNFFEKPSHIYDVTLKCTHCHKMGHDVQICPLRKLTYRSKITKSVWIPKGKKDTLSNGNLDELIPKGTKIVEANPKGPKKIWVPKNKV